MSDQRIIAVQVSADHGGQHGRGYRIFGDGLDVAELRPHLQPATNIERVSKPGPYSDIPYIEVWNGDSLVAVFCQHSIVGVYYEQPKEENESAG